MNVYHPASYIASVGNVQVDMEYKQNSYKEYI